MHEMSLCEGIVQILEQQARQQNYTAVKTVWLEIGQLSSVETEAMRFSFEMVSQGTLAENARLEIIEVAGQGWCSQCRQHVSISQRYGECPLCGACPLPVSDGEQMRIKELEVI